MEDSLNYQYYNHANPWIQDNYPEHVSKRTIAILKCHSLLDMWREKVKWMIKVKPYAWHWYGEYQKAICAPNRIGRILDRIDYETDFGGVNR